MSRNVSIASEPVAAAGRAPETTETITPMRDIALKHRLSTSALEWNGGIRMFTSALTGKRIVREFTRQPAGAPSWSPRPVSGRDMVVSTEILVVDDELDLRELLARVRTVLRRRADADARSIRPEAPPDTLRFGRWLLDLDAHKLVGGDGEELRLTSMEFDLLHAFARHPNKVLSRNQLLDLAHRRDWEPFDRSIDIRVARLRKKIERDPAKPQIIKTIPGAGYMYVSEGR